MMVTPDGYSRIELSKFISPEIISDHRNAPVNALGYLRMMFTVEDIDEMVGRLINHGAKLVGEVVQYQDSYRLCYIRGTGGDSYRAGGGAKKEITGTTEIWRWDDRVCWYAHFTFQLTGSPLLPADKKCIKLKKCSVQAGDDDKA
jgi:hypothetical protein